MADTETEVEATEAFDVEDEEVLDGCLFVEVVSSDIEEVTLLLSSLLPSSCLLMTWADEI